MNKLVTLSTYRDLIEAEIVKGRLESEGIQCALVDDIMVSVNPLYSNAIGGVKLKVFEEDYDKALEIIAGEKDTSDADDILSEPDEIPLQSPKGIVIFIAGVIIGATLLYVVYIKTMKAG
jgi:hypothetical protein